MTNQEIGRSLASSFVEMAQALDLLPKVEADLRDTQAELDKANARIAFLESHNTELGDKVVELEAKYADATKSATGHKSNVDLLLDEARKVIEHLTTAVDIIDPKPEVELPNPLSVGITGQSAPTTGEDTSPSVDPGYTETHYGEHSIIEPTRGEPIPQTAVGGDSEQQTSVTVNQLPFADPTSPYGSGPSDGDRSGGQSEENPTSATSMEGPVSAPTTTTVSDSPSGTVPIKDVRRPYWLKPSNMTWADWKAADGDVPSWVSEEMMHDWF